MKNTNYDYNTYFNRNSSNSNDNGNAGNNTQNSNMGGNKTMKNTIKERRAMELAAKEAETREAERQAVLAVIKPKNIVDTMEDTAAGIIWSVRNEDGNSTGVNGGKLYQKPVRGADGEMTTIAAESPEALEELEKNIENGLSGDGKFHKIVYFDGLPCDCVGSTLEELEQDILAAEEFYKAHGVSMLRDVDVAEQLVDAGYDQDDLEQVSGSDGAPYIICYGDEYVMDTLGNTIVNLDDIKSKLDKEDVKTLLVERLEKRLEEIAAEEEEDAWEEYWDEEYEYDEDDDSDENYEKYDDEDDDEEEEEKDYEEFIRAILGEEEDYEEFIRKILGLNR